MGKPSPYMTPESEVFWKGCKEGKFLYQECSTCNHKQFYPRIHCTLCGSVYLSWQESSGKGTIYSFSTIYRAPSKAFETPYILALVELDEGFRMMTNIIEVNPDEIAIGDKVIVDFETRENEMSIPQFREYLSFDHLITGKMYGEGTLECNEELIKQWDDIYPELTNGKNDVQMVPDGMIGVIVMNTYDTSLKGRPKGNVHGKQSFQVYRSVPVGETLTTRLFIEDKFIRKEKKWVIIRTETTTSQGILAVEGKMHILWAD